MKVALIHDYLKEYGGAERVLEALHDIFPNAPVYTAYYNPKSLGTNGKRFTTWDIRTSWYQHFPFANRLLSPMRLFAPMMFESFDLSEYDVVISSSATYLSKAVITKPETLHISYIHTPPRYLYGYATSFNYKKNPVTRILGEIANHFLRIYDFETSQRPDVLVANSKNVAERIKKFYKRDAVVIYPPIEIKNQKSKIKNESQKPKDYFLSLGRLVRGKGTEVIVEACTKLDLPLKVAGTGPEMGSLQNIAGKNVEFLGWVSDEERISLLRDAKAVIVASEDEDFGITPVEAQAVGTPVIAPRFGGFLETVIEGSPRSAPSASLRAGGAGKTGLFYGGPGQVSAESLTEALQKFNPKDFATEDCIKNAEKFSKEKFKKEILGLVESCLEGSFKKQRD